MGFKLSTHNGKVTIENPETGNHRTFSISTVQNKQSGLYGKRIVALLTGPNNEDDYTGFGFVTPQGDIKIWRKKSGNKIWHTYRDMLLNSSKWIEKGVRYHVEGRCRVCNRTLTVPESIESGIGPVCAKRS